MKSIHLWLPVFALIHSWSTNLCAQEGSSAIRLHRQPATVAVDNPTASASTFPAFSPPVNDDVSSDPQNGKSNGITAPALTVTSSLAVVLGLFAGLVWLTRKFGSRSMNHSTVPKEVLSSLGSTPIDPRTRITMLRCGNRILVVAQTASGIQPLSEISDPDEVRELTATCQGNSKHTFDSTLRSIEREKTNRGFVDAKSETKATSRSRLFATA